MLSFLAEEAEEVVFSLAILQAMFIFSLSIFVVEDSYSFEAWASPIRLWEAVEVLPF